MHFRAATFLKESMVKRRTEAYLLCLDGQFSCGRQNKGLRFVEVRLNSLESMRGGRCNSGGFAKRAHVHLLLYARTPSASMHSLNNMVITFHLAHTQSNVRRLHVRYVRTPLVEDKSQHEEINQ